MSRVRPILDASIDTIGHPMEAHPRHDLSDLLGPERFEAGLAALRDLHASWQDLVGGLLREGTGDEHYARYFLYYLTPALEDIARDGWIERHLRDYALLATSPALAPCCRTTVVELFGLAAFHVAVQFNPCADGLVQRLCHDPGDVRDHARQVARDVMHYSVADGTYPPPGLSHTGTRMYTATHRGALDLGW
jgi:hypothetical protein